MLRTGREIGHFLARFDLIPFSQARARFALYRSAARRWKKEDAMASKSLPLQGRSRVLLSASLIALFIPGCTFHHGGESVCERYQDIPLALLTAGTSHTVFETPGTIIAIQGSGTATHTAGNSAGAIKVQQMLTVPRYASQALVFLNGWKLDYKGGDRHMLALGAAITEIHFDPKLHTLTWDALGLIRDNDGKAGYDFAYQFTVVAWNAANLNAFVDQGAINSQTLDCSQTGGELPDNYFYATNSLTSTALSCFFTFLQNSSFPSSRPVAVLPRGFGFVWNDSDHNLFQIGYHMDHSETFADGRNYSKQGSQVPAPLPNLPASHVDSGFASWSPYAIFEDNDSRRDYTFAELVSGLAGNDVGVIQPPYSVLPVAADAPFLGIFTTCGETPGSNTTSEDHVIENVQYQHAVPMLTGWNMQYLCDDKHVQHIGVQIDDWSYQPPANGIGGILRYKVSSTLADDDSNRAHAITNRVTVLGLQGLTPANVGIGPRPTRGVNK